MISMTRFSKSISSQRIPIASPILHPVPNKNTKNLNLLSSANCELFFAYIKYINGFTCNSYNHPESSAYLSLFPCRFLLPVSYLLNPFLPPVSERDYALSANFLLWSSNHNNLSCACHIPVDHTKTFIKCLYHLAISDIYCHMADVLISSVACKTVEDKVSRL